jgi:hypothetical protein
MSLYIPEFDIDLFEPEDDFLNINTKKKSPLNIEINGKEFSEFNALRLSYAIDSGCAAFSFDTIFNPSKGLSNDIKPFGNELGIKPKYMYIKTLAEITNEKHVYTSFDIDYPNMEELSKYDKVKNTMSTMVVNFESDFKVNINYIFKFELTHSLPIYMENILGLTMKKMFLSLKHFIEMI